ncbi:MAG: DUF3386 domain-containing protein [Oscillatoria sp. PMC 1068.18]|nr:DUF3386 domain-containing protein [Oscillatoria sp. PMC 1076.18]MEC4988670.1 DUF3386 domain-containing protein [Oscillatoria sp. PMC 1068.18]
MSETNNAREIFQSAYENRYTWDENFPGYTANLEIKQGEETYQGQVKVNPDLSVEISGIEDEKVHESVYNQMRDVITHRKRSSFAAAHGKNQFTLGEKDSTGAVEILVSGDAMGSNYKVRGQEITQVSRVMGPMAFTINTKESLDTGSGYVSTAYNAVFRDAKTNELKGKRDFEETYDQVGDYYLPSCQVIHAIGKDGETITTEFNFSNLKLLETASVA